MKFSTDFALLAFADHVAAAVALARVTPADL